MSPLFVDALTLVRCMLAAGVRCPARRDRLRRVEDYLTRRSWRTPTE